MSLPKKDEKGYLAVERTENGALISGQKEHIAELMPLLRQRGIPCQPGASARDGEDGLLFASDADLAAVEEILESYKSPKGS